MIEVDDKLWPLLVLRFRAPHTQEEFDEMERQLEAIVARREPYATLVDARESHGVSPAQRQRQANWIKKNEADLRK